MKIKRKIKKGSEYSEYRKIIKMVNDAYKKASTFTKTDFQKKFERVYSSC